MKFCTACGSELKEGSAFCSSCGEVVQVDDAGEQSANTATQVSDAATQNVEAKQFDADEMKEKLSNTLADAKESLQENGYFEFLMQTIKQPTATIDHEVKSYGWVQLLVLMIMSTLSLYTLIRGVILFTISEFGAASLLNSFFGFDNKILSEVRFRVVPRLFMLNVVYVLGFLLAAFIVLKLFSKTKYSFTMIADELSGFFTLNLALISVAIILTFLMKTMTILGIGATLVGFSMLLMLVSYNYLIYKKTDSEKLDRLYILLIGNLILMIILSIIFVIQVEPLITLLDNIDNISNNFGW